MVDPDFLRFYSQELTHLRELGQEFATEFPKIASRLQLSAFDCGDPYVERLLEGFAFLSARIQKRFNDGFPRFTESLLNVVFPLATAPTPSMSIIKLTPDFSQAQLSKGTRIPAGTAFKFPTLTERQTACQFNSGMDVTLWPLEISEVKYLTTELGNYGFTASSSAQAAILIKLKSMAETPISAMPLDNLDLFVNMEDEKATSMLEHIFADGLTPMLRTGGVKPQLLPMNSVEVIPLGFSDNEALLPSTERRYRGIRLLLEYFAFPSRFKFFSLRGLKAQFEKLPPGSGSELSILLPLRKRVAAFAKAVEHDSLSLFCTPAANVFKMRCDRIIYDGSYEYAVTPDRTRPRDFEVYSIDSGTAYDADGKELFSHSRFYHVKDSSKASPGNFFDIHRRARLIAPGKGQRSSYTGADVFVTLSGPDYTEYADSIRQIGLNVLCTNRDLPLLLDPQGQMSFSEAPCLKSAAFAVRPGPPMPPPMLSKAGWSSLRHFKMTYSALVEHGNGSVEEAFKEILRLYAPPDSPFAQQQIDGLVSATIKPVTRRVAIANALPCFARGIEFTMTFDEFAFAGLGCFMFGLVLREFCSHFASINSFVEMVMKTRLRGEVIRWKLHQGTRDAI